LCAHWMHDGIEPVRDMFGLPGLRQHLGDCFLLLQPLPHCLAYLDIEAELQRVHPGILDARHPLRPGLAVCAGCTKACVVLVASVSIACSSCLVGLMLLQCM